MTPDKGSKTILSILVGAFLISSSLYVVSLDEDMFSDNEEKESFAKEREETEEDVGEAIYCLEEKGVVVYGDRSCPACGQLAANLGGYDVIEPIYVECSENWDRCKEEKKTGYVPEIQINKDLYKGEMNFQSLAQEVGCKT